MAEFKLSITQALADQLADALGKLVPAPLTQDRLAELQARPGVYELYMDGERVYVGKASKNLQVRLGKHFRKLSGRSGIAIGAVKFVCLYVDEDLEASAPEKLLIKKYRDHGGAPWNTNGFGNNDPGQKRDNSLVKAAHFDAIYPIDVDREVEIPNRAARSVGQLLKDFKATLPYNFRFDKSKDITSELATIPIDLPGDPITARAIIRKVIQALPEDWQATAFPGYVILYRRRASYDSARTIWVKDAGKVVERAGKAMLDLKGKVEGSDLADDDD